MANKLRMASNRAKDNILLLPTTPNSRVATNKINTLLKTNILLSQTTEATLRHTPQHHINNLHTHNKVLHTLSKARHPTNPLLLNLRTEPRKRIPTSLRTARTEMATSKKAYLVPMERRVSVQHL